MAAIGQEALKETDFLTNLRNVDALIHVLRAFENDAVPQVGPIDPLRDAKNVEFDLMVSDLDAGGEAHGARREGHEEGAHQRVGARAGAAACARRKRWKKRFRCASWR